jgi:DNA-directed RNA polymerase subunit M/transcription elongation factor TFIIS
MGARTSIQADRCHRCGGLMVPEQVFEIRSIDWHCVSCGERIDPVILAHRQVYRPEESASEDAKKLSADHGKRRLN